MYFIIKVDKIKKLILLDYSSSNYQTKQNNLTYVSLNH